jgi:beta-lactam-binding protein with PASTA domain
MQLRQRTPRRVRRIDEETAGPPVVEEEHYVPPRRPPVPEIWPWLLLFLLLVIGGLLAAYFLAHDHKHHGAGSVAVPAVVRMKQDEAARRLNERGLVPVTTAKVSKSPAGTVLAQDPGGGTDVARHSRVTLSVAALSLAQVPDVVGSKTSAALARLRAAGLTGQVTTVPAQAAADVVVAQSPAAGAKVAKSSTVSLKASKGPATVPDVRGQLAADAKGALRTTGLVPVEFQVPGTQPKGTVTAQKPLPNKSVPRGSKVRINVSTGSAGSGGGTGSTTTSASQTPQAPQKVTVPNVVGIQQSAAQRRLHDGGLRPRVKYVPSTRPVGVVTGQNPGGGTKVKNGSTVLLAVSRGPSPTLTVVPDVAGKTQQAATTTLQNAGFKVQVLTVKPANPSQSGKVVDEQPAGSTRAPEGSTVTIYVGSG